VSYVARRPRLAALSAVRLASPVGADVYRMEIATAVFLDGT